MRFKSAITVYLCCSGTYPKTNTRCTEMVSQTTTVGDESLLTGLTNADPVMKQHLVDKASKQRWARDNTGIYCPACSLEIKTLRNNMESLRRELQVRQGKPL